MSAIGPRTAVLPPITPERAIRLLWIRDDRLTATGIAVQRALASANPRLADLATNLDERPLAHESLPTVIADVVATLKASPWATVEMAIAAVAGRVAVREGTRRTVECYHTRWGRRMTWQALCSIVQAVWAGGDAQAVSAGGAA